MAETGSTRVRRRINTLFASISTKGGRRVPHSPPWAPPPFSHSQSKSTVHSMAARTGWKKVLCRASADSINPPPPPNPPTPLSQHRQAGTLCNNYRLQHTR